MIIDSHAHIFDSMRGATGSGVIQPLTRGRIRMGNGDIVNFLPPLAEEIRFTPEMLLAYMDEAGIAKAILLQGPFYGDMNHYVQQAVKQWPDRFTGAAYLDLWSENPREHFQYVVDQLGFRIIKLEISSGTGLSGLHPGLRLDDPELHWFWEQAEMQRLTIVLDLGQIDGPAYQTRCVDGIAAKHPSLKLVIAHLAQPPVNAPGGGRLDQQWQDQVRLALRPNIWLDLASLPNYAIAAGEDFPYPSACKYLRRAVQIVGTKKILWGSDIPATLLRSTYSQLLGFLTLHCDFLSRAELAQILGENAGCAFSLSDSYGN